MVFLYSFVDIVKIPIAGRTKKPRESGLTMVIDKGLGLRQTQDLVEIAGDHIDIVKLAFGTSRLCPEEVVKKKIEVYKAQNIYVMPGGTFLEVVVAQGVLDKFLLRMKEYGFNAIEVSDGTIPMDDVTRANVLKAARDHGFKIIAEVGSKFKESDLSAEEFVRGIKRDLKLGAWKVIIEAREAGKGVGIYDEKGEIVKEKFEKVISGVFSIDDVIFEAPEKKQQTELILKFGPNVNLGNVQPADIVALEALRIGLRADTLKGIYK
ncbi:MAG: phosphosulfolactate synthase [Nitrososphaerota archaeon]|nr:phosphosulfolactate synthase [Nitrososphaerota archaeon]